MFRWATLLGLLGLAVATALIVWSGLDLVLQALTQAGWGLVVVALYNVIPLAVSSEGWRVLVPGKTRLSSLRFVYVMWVRAAVNNLMPVARIGGEIAAVRLLTAYGMRKNAAIAITLVELTLSVVAVFLCVGFGVVLFAFYVNDENTTMQLGWGLVVSAPLIAAFALVQRIGFFGLLARLFRLAFREKWRAMAVGSAAALDRAVSTVYRRRWRVLVCGASQFAGWVLGAGEIWLALFFVGHPFSLLESFMLESLIQGAASMAFAVPGALGVQEAGFLVFGGMLGLPRDVAAALAVIRRCRDLIFYAPALVAWQIEEGKKLFER
ncbi:MAG: flippase-like domain-containing protein [Alphaproteobacteria bacterium]|nr:flippase-like domain-containing protein [Alphaproteobacteria bacterium]